ncbi:hypothetical protein AAY473_017801 [Plecturocebus cupreus]
MLGRLLLNSWLHVICPPRPPKVGGVFNDNMAFEQTPHEKEQVRLDDSWGRTSLVGAPVETLCGSPDPIFPFHTTRADVLHEGSGPAANICLDIQPLDLSRNSSSVTCISVLSPKVSSMMLVVRATAGRQMMNNPAAEIGMMDGYMDGHMLITFSDSSCPTVLAPSSPHPWCPMGICHLQPLLFLAAGTRANVQTIGNNSAVLSNGAGMHLQVPSGQAVPPAADTWNQRIHTPQPPAYSCCCSKQSTPLLQHQGRDAAASEPPV